MKKCGECGAFTPTRYDFEDKPVSGICAKTKKFVVADQNCKIEIEKEKNSGSCATCNIDI